MLLVENSGTKDARDSKRLAVWAWRSLYLVSVEEGCILPVQFYSDLSSLLASHNMIPQLVEILLYTSLLPSLSLDLDGAVTHLLAKTILSRRSLGVGVGGREVVQDVGLVLPQDEE